MSEGLKDERRPLADDHAHVLTLLAVETLRKAAQQPAAQAPPPEGRLAVFWRIFGATLLSIAAMAALAVYQQFTSDLASLHRDLDHLTEARTNLVEHAEFTSQMNETWRSIKELQTINIILAALKERDALFAQQIKGDEAEVKELRRELQQLREHLAAVEVRAGVVPPPKPPPAPAE